ncbi:MAG TPA: thioredoxin [Chitinivibrionales bacterium]|nr:thioredoxin [Chitinivibrionales bacterium]
MPDLPSSFEELIFTYEKPVLVDFWAVWCAPCRIMSPTIEQIAKEYSGRLLAIKVNVDDKPLIATRYQIGSIPTVMMFWKGKPVLRIIGAQPLEEVKRQIDEHWPEQPSQAASQPLFGS